MDRIPILLIATLVGTTVMVVTALFAGQVTTFVRRYFPNFTFEEETFLLWGLLLSSTFAIGLAALYLILRR